MDQTIDSQIHSLIIESLPEHIAVMDQSSRIVFVNRAWKIFADQNDLNMEKYGVGQNYIDLCEKATGAGSEQADEIAGQLRKLLAGEIKSFSIDYPCHAPDQQRWFRLNGTYFTINNARWAVVIHENITAIKQTAMDLIKKEKELLVHQARKSEDLDNLVEQRTAELNNSNQRLKLILDTVSDAFWDWQIDTGEVYFSSRYYTMLGYTPYELPQSFDTWKSLVHPDDRVAAEETIIRHIHSNEPFEMEFRMKTKEDTYRWILGRGKTVEKDVHGKARRMVGTHIDLTERNNMEEQLRHSQKMEAMGFLAGGIAHDFNNILSAIIGYAELAAEEIPEDTQVFKRISGILSASDRARNLISQILTFSRKQDKNFQPMDIRMALKEALGFMRASLPSTIQISEQIHSALPNIMGDPDQIHQLIINLMTNASHAIKPAGTIHIETDLVEIGHKSLLPASMGLVPGTFVKLTVSDTGCGIAPDMLSKIFDPFFTTKEKGFGTGLGLSIVHGIVKAHGGDISVESSPDFGTRFEVFLPVTIRDNVALDDKKLSPPGGTEKILIVDDEEVLPVILQDMLEALGYTVTTLTDSREALQLFKPHPNRFDILLSDITMPHMTGIELTQAFQQIRRDIPVVLWSGNNSSITEQKAMEIGASKLLHKPFKRMDLAVAIRTALDNAGTGGQNEV